MGKRLLPALIALTLANCHDSTPRPRLVVVVAVDQMRADFLSRFADQYEAGLARLVADGAVFTNAHAAHALTFTSAGLTAISTGADPSNNGIVDNWWWDRTLRRTTYSVQDDSASIIGVVGAGGISPANIRRDGLSGWLKAASPRSKVFSVALKDRAAVLLGGRRAEGAYWMHSGAGRFVTSTHYRRDYPEWVKRFNHSTRIDAQVSRVWELLLPEAAYSHSREDDFSGEDGGRFTTFPHERHASKKYERLMRTPFGDELTLEFASEMILNEGLGEDAVPDLLWISLSSADEIGHIYGPNSREIHDYYLRLDRMLAEFVEFLDAQIGVDSYVLALSSDHGVRPLTESLVRDGIEAATITSVELEAAVNRAIAATTHELEMKVEVALIYRSGLVLDFDGEPSADRIRAFWSGLLDRLRAIDFIADAFTRDELIDPRTPTRPYLEMFRKSFDAERSPDVLFLMKKNHLVRRERTGTTHGTPYDYDTHVPIIFYGAGIRAGSYASPAAQVDLAPTLAVLLGIGNPADTDGRPLMEALR